MTWHIPSLLRVVSSRARVVDERRRCREIIRCKAERAGIAPHGAANDASHAIINVGFKNTRWAQCRNTSFTNGIRVHQAVSPFPLGSDERRQVALFFASE